MQSSVPHNIAGESMSKQRVCKAQFTHRHKVTCQKGRTGGRYVHVLHGVKRETAAGASVAP